MNSALAFVLLVSGTFSSLPQTPSTAEESIHHALDIGGFDGHLIKTVGHMGDAAAIVVTRVVADKTVSAGQIDTILEILTYAFADPGLVDNPADREPRTALFVLRSMDTSSTDPDLKRRIAETRKYILDHYDKYKAR